MLLAQQWTLYKLHVTTSDLKYFIIAECTYQEQELDL